MTFWDIAAPLYDSFERVNKAHRKMIGEVCGLVPRGASVLELACGTGSISLAVGENASDVLATDISGSMLRIAQRKARNKRNIKFEKASIYKTGMPDNSFDVVIASQILHLIDEPQKACEEIMRVARGMAIMPVPLLKESTAWGRLLIGLYRALGFRPKRNFDSESCKAFLEGIGFGSCEYRIIRGTVSLCVAVWSKK